MKLTNHLLSLDREEDTMGARSKLNSASLNACLLIAGTVGILAGSWTVFAIALAGVVATRIISGSIRLTPTNRK
jgi:hypothetical protein